MTDASARTLAVAAQAFNQFKNGLSTGHWQPWLDLLSDDFTFHFPTGRFRGRHQGRAKAAEFFAYVRSVYPEGLSLELDRVTGNDTTAVFEFHDWGKLVVPGQAPRDYRNRVVVSLDVSGDKISAYREYFGSDGTSDD